MIMKLGFTLYNFHSVIDSLEDLDNVLAKLENMGVDTVQVSGIGYLNNYDVAKLCKKHGMEVCLTHLSFDRIVNDTDAVIEEHKALGCKNVGIGWIEEKYRGEDGVKKFVEELTPAVKKLHAAGMTFSYHNHQFEFMRYPNGKTGYQMLTELDAAGVKPIECVGQEFDPDFHNAVMQVENDELESGTVAQELQKGYMYKDSVVRHSMVSVVQ